MVPQAAPGFAPATQPVSADAAPAAESLPGHTSTRDAARLGCFESPNANPNRTRTRTRTRTRALCEHRYGIDKEKYLQILSGPAFDGLLGCGEMQALTLTLTLTLTLPRNPHPLTQP